MNWSKLGKFTAICILITVIWSVGYFLGSQRAAEIYEPKLIKALQSTIMYKTRSDHQRKLIEILNLELKNCK